MVWTTVCIIYQRLKWHDLSKDCLCEYLHQWVRIVILRLMTPHRHYGASRAQHDHATQTIKVHYHICPYLNRVPNWPLLPWQHSPGSIAKLWFGQLQISSSKLSNQLCNLISELLILLISRSTTIISWSLLGECLVPRPSFRFYIGWANN